MIDGQRLLTVENIHRFAEAMNLWPFETEFFEALVLFSQAKSQAEKTYYKQRLLKLRSQVSENIKPRGISGLLSEWYYPAVLSALDQESTDTDLQKIAEKCSVPITVLRKAIELFLSQGVLVVIENKYQVSHPHIHLEDRKSNSMVLRSFLSHQLQLSRRAFDQSYQAGATFLSQTFTCSKKNIQLYNDQVHLLLDTIFKISDQDERSDIGQINIQLFTLDQVRKPN